MWINSLRYVQHKNMIWQFSNTTHCYWTYYCYYGMDYSHKMCVYLLFEETHKTNHWRWRWSLLSDRERERKKDMEKYQKECKMCLSHHLLLKWKEKVQYGWFDICMRWVIGNLWSFVQRDEEWIADGFYYPKRTF